MKLEPSTTKFTSILLASSFTAGLIGGCAVQETSPKPSVDNLSTESKQEVLRINALNSGRDKSSFKGALSNIENPAINKTSLAFLADSKKSLDAFYGIVTSHPELNRLLPKDPQGKTIEKAVMVHFMDNQESKRARLLMGSEAIRIEIGKSVLAAQNTNNLKELYKLVYKALPKKLQSRSMTPEEIANMTSSAAIQEVLTELVKNGGNIFGSQNNHWDMEAPYYDDGIKLELKTHSCEDEVGYELGSDLDITSEKAYNANGIMKNIRFKLRNQMSCVKDQGQRGSCAAFATIAAFETLAANKYNDVFVNLSEQELYWYAETKLQIDFEEGLNTSQLLNQIEDYFVSPQPEFNWNYNPSIFRTATGTDAASNFDAVCDKYDISPYFWSSSGEMCTETVGQGESRRLSSGGWAVEEPSDQTTGYLVNNVTSIWNILDLDTSLSAAKVLLKDGHPLVFSLSIPKPMPNRTLEAGYLDHNLYSGNDTVGGHAVLMIGFVTNSQMEAISGVPAASGGGYFVVKNSWGWSSGDHGYLYLPYDFVKEYGTALNSVDPSGLLD